MKKIETMSLQELKQYRGTLVSSWRGKVKSQWYFQELERVNHLINQSKNNGWVAFLTK